MTKVSDSGFIVGQNPRQRTLCMPYSDFSLWPCAINYLKVYNNYVVSTRNREWLNPGYRIRKGGRQCFFARGFFCNERIAKGICYGTG